MSTEENFRHLLDGLIENEDGSVSQAARKLGYARTYVSAVRSGKRVPGRKFIEAVASYDPDSAAEPEDEEEMSFNPKIEELLAEIMEDGGFDTRKECLAALIREKGSQLRQPAAPAPEAELSGNPGQLAPQTRTRRKTGIESLDNAMSKLDKDVEKLKKKFE